MAAHHPVTPQGKTSPEKPWFLGIDLGTGSCKSVVVNEQAQVLGYGTSDYAAANTQQKWQEQDPEAMLAGMLRSVNITISQAGVSPRACQGLSIGGALHSLLAVDHSGRPITGVITWADNRGNPQAQMIRQTIQASSDLYQQTGCPTHGMYPLYKILWLRQERPEIFDQAARFISAKEYILWKLHGQYIVDYSLASGSGLLNTRTLNWNPLSLDITAIQPDVLSRLASPTEILHGLDPAIAQAMNLNPNVPIVLGSSDAANSNLGAGAVHPWQATCMVGTSGAFRIISPHPVLDQMNRTWCYAIDETHWLVGGAINNGGIALSWLKDVFQQAFPELSVDKPITFLDLINLASQAGPGAGGLVCLPFFAGERSPNWNLNARAIFFGLTIQHEARHLARAILEGVAFRLRTLTDILSEIVGEINEVRGSGGFTHSQLWPQIVSSAINRDLLIPSWGETSSLGAALWAMLGAGAITNFIEVSESMTHMDEFHPILQETAIYDQVYRVYVELYEQNRSLFDQIAKIQDKLMPHTDF